MSEIMSVSPDWPGAHYMMEPSETIIRGTRSWSAPSGNSRLPARLGAG